MIENNHLTLLSAVDPANAPIMLKGSKVQIEVDGTVLCLAPVKYSDKPCEGSELKFVTDCTVADFTLTSQKGDSSRLG